jgi:outer membrane protein assembly factor BamB
MHTQGHPVEAWTLRTAEAVGAVTAAAAAGWSLVATGDKVVHVLDKKGKVQGRFKAGQPIRQLGTNCDGTVLAALAGEAVIYAFSHRGDLEWRVELGGAVTAFALTASGEQLAAVSAGGWLYTYSMATRERQLAPVGWPMASVAVADGEQLRIVVAGEKGRLAMLGAEGKPQWQHELKCKSGPVVADEQCERIFVPAHGRGLLVFGADGKEAGRLQLGGDVVRAAAGPEGFPVMVEVAGGRFLLVGEDSSVLWSHACEAAPGAWSFGAAGTRLLVCEGERSVVARAVTPTQEAPAGRPAAGAQPSPPAEAPEASEPVELDMPEYLEIEEAMAEATPQPSPSTPERHLKWKKRLPAAMLPVVPGSLGLGSDGTFAVLVLADGTVVALDREGTPAIQCVAEGPAEIVPPSFTSTVGVRAGTTLHVMDMTGKNVREVALGEKAPVAFGCSDDLTVAYVLDRAGELCAIGQDGEFLWRKEVGEEAESLLVSPDGRTVLVCDLDRRFRYYNAEGNIQRKFRLGQTERHRAVALGNDYTAFVGRGGQLTMLDAKGHQLWAQRLFQTVTRVERLDRALAVYGEDGVCAVVEPRRDRVWEFVPPPGRVLLRKPASGDPLLVHAAGPVVTVFSGYRRKLDLLWRCRCGGEVEQFDADRDARCIIALAEGRLDRFEGASP